jgi:16S rRNA processing protein RimM
MALAADDWVALGEVARPHGVRGEVRVRLYNPDSDLLLEADEVLVRLKEGDEHEVSVDGARRADDAILLKLHSIDDRDRADELRGAVLSMRRGDFPALDAGEFYYCDVIGAEAVAIDATGAERPFGTVEGFRSYPSTETILIRSSRGVLEVPMLENFVETIDGALRRVVLKNLDALDEAL